MQPSFLQRVAGGDTQIKKDEEGQFSRNLKVKGSLREIKGTLLGMDAYFFSFYP